MNKCLGCSYYRQLYDSSPIAPKKVGECRRFPPPMPPPTSPTIQDNPSVYPVVRQHSWCGEWQDRSD